ncbi:MAG: ABC transporter ATP-binding protein [Gammaproteobacteria bacterium]
MSETVLRCVGLSRTYAEGDLNVPVLRGVDLEVRRGERIAIVGRSGAGKSTLLHLLGGLDLPSAGFVEVAGRPMSALGDAARGRLRNAFLGFVYQFHHLLPEFTAAENVAMPMLIAGVREREARARALDLLGRVGLADRAAHKPGELSGGERQRTAVARALANQPQCVLADEPTGNLDRQSAALVFDQLLALHAQTGATIVIVTHDPLIAAAMDRVLELRDGALEHAPDWSGSAPPHAAT